jgi:hypothetical protein
MATLRAHVHAQNLRKVALWTALVGCAIGIGACGLHDDPYAGQTAVPLPTPTGTRQAVAEENLLHLWPLTVDHGTIECRDRQYAIFIAPDQKEYALNEAAEREGYQSIDRIRRPKASLGALRGHVLALCEPSQFR